MTNDTFNANLSQDQISATVENFNEEFLQEINREEINPNQAYDYFIPGHVSCLPISRDVKFLYALIRNLCNSNNLKKWKGCTWVRNDTLAANMEVTTRCLQKWLKKLADYEVIVIELFRDKEFGTKRCIWLKEAYDHFQKFLKHEQPFTPSRTAVHPVMNGRSLLYKDKIGKDKDIKRKESVSQPSAQPTLSEPSVRLTHFFFEKLKEINPRIRDPIFEKWREEMQQMLDNDKRTPEEIEAIIEFILRQHKNPDRDFTWSRAVQSPRSLRKNFDQIALELNAIKPAKAKDVAANQQTARIAANKKLTEDTYKKIEKKLSDSLAYTFDNHRVTIRVDKNNYIIIGYDESDFKILFEYALERAGVLP